MQATASPSALYIEEASSACAEDARIGAAKHTARASACAHTQLQPASVNLAHSLFIRSSDRESQPGSHAGLRGERSGAAAGGQLPRAAPALRRRRRRWRAHGGSGSSRGGVRAPDDRRRLPDARRRRRRLGGGGSGAGGVRGGHRARRRGVGVLPGAQPRRGAGAPGRDAAGAGAPVPPPVRGQVHGRPPRRLLPLGHPDRDVPAAALLVRGLPRPARRRLRRPLQLRRPHRPQGRDAGGGGRDVEAGRHAGARARGGAPGGAARVVVGAVPGRGVRRDDVLPPAEPVPAVPGVPGRLRPGAAHRQRLPHRALPGPRRRPAAHEGRQVGGRQAHPRRPHRQHRGPLPGLEQQQIQERGAQGGDQRHDGALLRRLLPLPVLRLAHRHLRGAFSLQDVHVRGVPEQGARGRQENRQEDRAP